MSGHTPGPWFANDQTGHSHPYIEIRGCNGGPQVAYRYAAKPHEVASFNRIVSCVNALEGLDPAAVADVVAAAEALIQNRDDNCADREEYKQGGEWGDYWSPAASMVNSKEVAALRTALARIRGEG